MQQDQEARSLLRTITPGPPASPLGSWTLLKVGSGRGRWTGGRTQWYNLISGKE